MEPDIGNISVAAFYLCLALSAFIVVWKGGAPERLGLLALVGMGGFQLSIYALTPPRFYQPDGAAIAADSLGFICFAAIALSAKRMWPSWAASMQLLSLTAHVARFANVHVDPLAYSILKSAPTAFVAVILIIGTVAHQRRLHGMGEDPSWQDWKRLRTKRSMRRT